MSKYLACIIMTILPNVNKTLSKLRPILINIGNINVYCIRNQRTFSKDTTTTIQKKI